MARTIYLAVFSNEARPAHWSVFIPATGLQLQGKVIHVTGTTATGFFLEFKRNYDFITETRHYQLIPLADVDDRYISDTPEKGELVHDTTARDRIESAATIVPPPGRSANPFSSTARNCQNWMADFVQRLLEDGYVTSAAIEVVENAPKRL